MHCLGYMFYHRDCWFHRFQFCDSCFGFCSSNTSNVFDWTKHLWIHYDLLLQQHFIHTFVFLCSLLSSIKNQCIFVFKPKNTSIATLAVSLLIYQQLIFLNHFNLFESLIIFWLKWITTKIKLFFFFFFFLKKN